ncbi:unnamed protein product [Staurois parvus]|uniref:Uncharacterized protein n=1 Tax=Staurois parvus TaxID=386267 RepID=A0ABN9BAZ6_9NEOB|nr:unnamed protein product [Staurois parvus]
MPISSTYQCCQSVPPSSAISARQCCLSVRLTVPVSAAYQCNIISAAYQCPSVLPISAT